MDTILQVLCETPVIVHGTKFVEAECLTLSTNKKRERQTLCMPKEDWKCIKEGLQAD